MFPADNHGQLYPWARDSNSLSYFMLLVLEYETPQNMDRTEPLPELTGSKANIYCGIMELLVPFKFG